MRYPSQEDCFGLSGLTCWDCAFYYRCPYDKDNQPPQPGDPDYDPEFDDAE